MQVLPPAARSSMTFHRSLTSPIRVIPPRLKGIKPEPRISRTSDRANSIFVEARRGVVSLFRENEEISARVFDCEFSPPIPVDFRPPFDRNMLFQLVGKLLRAIDIDRDRRAAGRLRRSRFGCDELHDHIISRKQSKTWAFLRPR